MTQKRGFCPKHDILRKNHPLYICHSPEEFELLEASGKFACTGENLSDQNKVALAKQLIDQNCLEGFGSLCELPVTAALSLRLSESYKPQVFLFLPNETEYFSKLAARFGEGSGDNQDKKILEKLKEEYFSILSIHENNPGMFKLVLSLQCVQKGWLVRVSEMWSFLRFLE